MEISKRKALEEATLDPPDRVWISRRKAESGRDEPARAAD
jgi:hypothetical protein